MLILYVYVCMGTGMCVCVCVHSKLTLLLASAWSCVLAWPNYRIGKQFQALVKRSALMACKQHTHTPFTLVCVCVCVQSAPQVPRSQAHTARMMNVCVCVCAVKDFNLVYQQLPSAFPLPLPPPQPPVSPSFSHH